jgi:DNA-directed RNA polymerase subunit RPC12/RpoP
MQRLSYRCPRCDHPLGISWDMWGKYYLCRDCGFTAEDDDELNGKGRQPRPPRASGVIRFAGSRSWQASSKG